MAKSDTPKEIDVDINEATHAQLLHFAEHQNLSIDKTWSKGQLLAQIKKAWQYPTISVPAEVAPVPTHIPPELAVSSGPKSKIILQAVDDDPEGVVEGAVNGVAYRIQRGVPVEVSEEIMESLRNAVSLRYDPQRDGGIGEPRHVQAVPFTKLN